MTRPPSYVLCRRRDAGARVAAALRHVFGALSCSTRRAIDANAPSAEGRPGGTLTVRVTLGHVGEEEDISAAVLREICARVAGVYAVEAYLDGDVAAPRAANLPAGRAFAVYRKVAGAAVPADGARRSVAEGSSLALSAPSAKSALDERKPECAERLDADDDMLFPFVARCGPGGCWHYVWALAPRWRMDAVHACFARGEEADLVEHLCAGRSEVDTGVDALPIWRMHGHPGFLDEISSGVAPPLPFPWEACTARCDDGSLQWGWTSCIIGISEHVRSGVASLEVQRADLGLFDEICALSSGEFIYRYSLCESC